MLECQAQQAIEQRPRGGRPLRVEQVAGASPSAAQLARGQ